MTSDAPEILFERRGAAGIVTLNRPKALNAVTHGMVRRLHAQLDAWRDDPAVTRVVVTGAGDRAFSAGGDLRGIYEAARAGRQQESLAFWRDEYRLNAAIKFYPKPYVALIDGIVMGGGAGLSVHGSHRVAGDRFAFAMPEVGIGFFPDVGATWFLPRCPGAFGTYPRAHRRAARRRRRRRRRDRHPPRRVGSLRRSARRAVRRGAGRCADRRLCRAGRGGAARPPPLRDRSHFRRPPRRGYSRGARSRGGVGERGGAMGGCSGQRRSPARRR